VEELTDRDIAPKGWYVNLLFDADSHC